MKTLPVFLVSLFVFQVLLFASTVTEARSLLALESKSNCWFMKAGFGGRPQHPHSPPPYVLRGSIHARRPPPRRPPPPPPPGYSPGPGPGKRSPQGSFIHVIGSLPSTSEHAPTRNDILSGKSPPNPLADSAI